MPKKLIILLLLASCMRAPTAIEPTVQTPMHPKEIMRQKRCLVILPKDFSCSPFPKLSEEERKTDWGKEYYLAQAFAADFDLYRAITGFKRALFLDPPEERRYEIQYSTLLAYFLGKKYTEVAFIAQSTPLGTVSNQFPAFHDLVLILHETYSQLGEVEHAQNLLTMLDEEKRDKLLFLSVVKSANFEQLLACADERPYLTNMLRGYHKESKSVKAAELLNAALPGAGYWYVGQKQTAMTALLVNSLFAGTAAYFFSEGNIPAALITLSLESGWYFGGIYGAGLAAKSYNEKIYKHYAERIGDKEQYYPQLMIKYSF